MDWSLIKSLAIPDGNVVKVEAGGVVLWEKPQEGMTYTFTGQSNLVETATGWELYLLSDGTLTFTSLDGNVDVFLCGGGGSGAKNGTNYTGGGGGAGGYTTTQKDIQLSANTAYAIVVGDGGAEKTANGRGNDGEATTAFGYTANGGNGGRSGTGSSGDGGCGGTGGGAGGYSTTNAATDGAIDGNDSQARGSFLGGIGQGRTTRAFEEICEKLYASGGGGGAGYSSGTPTSGKNGKGYFGAGTGGLVNTAPTAVTANRGCGGGGSCYGTNGGAGSSGIVIVRKHKAVADYIAIMPTDTNKFPAVLNGYGYEALHGDASGRSSSYVGSVYAKPWLSQPAKKLGHAFSEIGNWVGNFADYAYGDVAVGYSADSTSSGTQALNVWISPTLITAAEANALIEAANAHILYELFTPDPESLWYAVMRTSDGATGYLNPETGVFHQPKGGIPHA